MLGFLGDKKGISYIETGPSVYVRLYSSENLDGISHVVHPDSSEWLEVVPFGANTLYETVS